MAHNLEWRVRTQTTSTNPLSENSKTSNLVAQTLSKGFAKTNEGTKYQKRFVEANLRQSISKTSSLGEQGVRQENIQELTTVKNITIESHLLPDLRGNDESLQTDPDPLEQMPKEEKDLFFTRQPLTELAI